MPTLTPTHKKILAGLLILLALVFAPDKKTTSQILGLSHELLSSEQNPTDITLQEIKLSANQLATNSAKVIRVIDGDTIELEGGLKVRYIGIDTPETVAPGKGTECFGEEASKANQELVLNQQVWLETDISNTDRFGRLLRYVYLEDPSAIVESEHFDQMVNAILVKDGFASAASFPPDIKHQTLFENLEKEAKNKNLGLWGNTCGR